MKTPLRIASTALALAALLTGAASARPPAKSAPAAPRQVKQYTIDQFLANTSYGGASFSPDGRKILLSSNETASPAPRRSGGRTTTNWSRLRPQSAAAGG